MLPFCWVVSGSHRQCRNAADRFPADTLRTDAIARRNAGQLVARIFGANREGGGMKKRNENTPERPLPPLPHGAPGFFCPFCETPLHYDRSHASADSEELIDLKDYYRCPGGCGTFEHDRRMRRLRLLGSWFEAPL
jgi:hypothetical protein